MYLGAQRVMGEGNDRPVTTYLYLHGGLLSAQHQAMLNDVRWVSQLAPGQLAREKHKGRSGGRRIVSYLEVSGPDETDLTSLGRVLDELAKQVVSGRKAPIKLDDWGAEFYRGAEVSQEPEQEFGDLRALLEEFFAEGENTPPVRELTVLVRLDAEGTRFEWDEASQTRLKKAAPQWIPYRLSISDDVRDSFQQQHGALFPHVLAVLQPGEVPLETLGGVVFKDEPSGKVLWFSPSH